MASWKSPGRAVRVVIYEEDGTMRHYWRSESESEGTVWREQVAAPGKKPSGDALDAEQLIAAVAAAVNERRRASRGRKFRL